MERRLTAILAADLAGYSRLIRADEEGTLAAFTALREDAVDPVIARHNGRIVKLMGDGILAEFASVVDAVRGAAEIQRAAAAHGSNVPDDRRLIFRIGVNLGDVVIDGDDIQGDGVNVAARLESLAEPGGICISAAVYEQVRDRLDLAFDDIGEQSIKNIDRPVRAWQWSPNSDNATAGPDRAAPGTAGVAAVDDDKPSVAVLPFDNMSGDPEQAYFADGIAEDIITDLSKVSGLFVIARNSSFGYRGQSPDIRRVSQELGARYVLEGSVRKAGNRVRINAQMIDGADGRHVWADRFDRDLADIFEVQDEVTREIVGALKIALTAGEETNRQARRKVDPEAYDLFVRARSSLLRFSEANVAEAKRQLEQVVEIDPTLAVARAGLSLCYSTEYLNDWNTPGPDHLDKALAIAEEACRIDPSEPQAFHALALVSMWRGDLEAAKTAAEQAVTLNPNHAAGHAALGQVQEFTGNHAEAVASAETVLRLDPHYDIALQLLGRAQFAQGNNDAAEAAFQRRLEINPTSSNSRVFLAALHGLAGDGQAAAREWQEIFKNDPGFLVDKLESRLAYQSPDVFDRLREGLTRAGIDIQSD